ncbi:MAG: YncE family protein [Gemmatimonadota bacterium]|nr:YncE family protein [Gemmatimonadota bacterium]
MMTRTFQVASLAIPIVLMACSAAAGEPHAVSAPPAATPDTSRVYYAYVGAESADLMHRVRLGPDGVSVDHTVSVGEIAVEVEGPHGFNVSPDGAYVYMTTGHGVPGGKLWKFHAGPDTLVARPAPLGYFPATLDLTADGQYAFVANFNLHGEHVPSTVSVVYTPDLVEVARITTCTMPHGLRVDPSGLFAYSMCMMDDQLVEIDTRSFRVARRFSVAHGGEGPVHDHDVQALSAGRDMPAMTHDLSGAAPSGAPTCSPTWAEPSPDGSVVYVACNKADEILVIDRGSWALERRIPTGRGPYNLDVTPDGRILVASLKQGGQVQFFAAATGESLGVVPSSTTVTHGVAVSSDSRYAFVSVEGKGAEAGKVDVYDLATFQLIGSAEVGQQAGGIVFWKSEILR